MVHILIFATNVEIEKVKLVLAQVGHLAGAYHLFLQQREKESPGLTSSQRLYLFTKVGKISDHLVPENISYQNIFLDEGRER
jgi:hypothetical protein